MVKNTATNKKPDAVEVQNAKRAFFISLFDLTWRLLSAMLLPIFAGLLLDSIFNTNKVFAMVGFVIGMVGGVLVIRSMVKKMSGKVL